MARSLIEGAGSRMESVSKVSPKEFLQLLVSRRQLARFDLPKQGQRGLRDRRTGQVLVVAERDLLSERLRITQALSPS
jgi:hypothetical protein